MQSDTYAQPARPSNAESLARLSDALSGFSNSLGNLVPVMDKKDDDAQLLTLQKQLAGMAEADKVRAVQEGRVVVGDTDLKTKAIQASHGMAYGSHMVAETQRHLQTEFDWDSGNPDQFIIERIQHDLETYGHDRNFVSAYLRSAESVRSWAIEYGQKRNTEQFVQAQGNAAFLFIDTKVDELITAGADPKVISQQVMQWYADLGKDGTLGVDYDQLDQEVLNKARRITTTHPEVALAFLTAKRRGRGGQDLSIATNPAMRDDVLRIRAAATKAISDQAESAFLDMTLADDEDLLRHGNLDLVRDLRYTTQAGEEKVLSRDERVERAKERYFAGSIREAAAKRETSDATMARELRALRISGEKHPVVEANVSGIAGMASTDILQDPQGLEKLKGKLQAYQWLQGESTTSLLSYTTQEDRDFAETYLMATRYLTHENGNRYSDDEALTFAIRSTQITAEGKASIGQHRDAIEDAVGSLGSEAGWLWGTKDVEPANAAAAEQRVSLLAQRFVATGVKPDKAVRMAAEAIKKTSVVYRGVLLDLQGHDLPDNFADGLDSFIDDFAKSNPLTLEQNGLSAGDVSIAPILAGGNSGGKFMLVDKTDLTGIVGDDGRPFYITIPDVRSKAREITQEREHKALQDAMTKDSLEHRGIVQAVDVDGRTYWVNEKTREVMDFTLGDDDLTPVWRKTGRRYKRNVITTPVGGFNTNDRADTIGAAATSAAGAVFDAGMANARAVAAGAKAIGKALPEVKIGEDAFKDKAGR